MLWARCSSLKDKFHPQAALEAGVPQIGTTEARVVGVAAGGCAVDQSPVVVTVEEVYRGQINGEVGSVGSAHTTIQPTEDVARRLLIKYISRIGFEPDALRLTQFELVGDHQVGLSQMRRATQIATAVYEDFNPIRGSG